jgi:hypothetical protein
MIDMTGNWYLPFIMTMVLMGTGIAAAFLMHPERPLALTDPDLPMGEVATAV